MGRWVVGGVLALVSAGGGFYPSSEGWEGVSAFVEGESYVHDAAAQPGWGSP